MARRFLLLPSASLAAALALQGLGAGAVRLEASTEGRAEAEASTEAGAEAEAEAEAGAASAAEEDSIEAIQECVDACRGGGDGSSAASVKMTFVTTDGPFPADKDMAAAGCFFNLAREAFFAMDEDEEEGEVQVDLATGFNDWSRVSQDILETMLAFGHSKLSQANFEVAKVEFSEVARPVRSDLTEANVSKDDAEFMQKVADRQKLFSLATAAHFVDFPELYQLCTAKIATMIWGKTKDEIQATLTSQS